LSARGLVRRSALAAARSRGFDWFVATLERALPPRPGTFSVLTYHRVAHSAGSPLLYPGLFTDPSEFAKQMAFVTSRYRAISLEELLAVRRGEKELPLRSVLVTFDDGYRDFAEHAWPILQQHRIPAVLFIPTSFPGNPGRAFWWDRLYGALRSKGVAGTIDSPIGMLRFESEADRLNVYRRLRATVQSLPHEEAMSLVDEICEPLGAPPAQSEVLGWPDVRRLKSEGVDLAPHSRTHPLLDKVPVETARAEIVGSLEDLEREVGRGPRVFAYPGGGESRKVAHILGEEGFELAFTTTRGTNDVRTADWLRLRRINVGRASAVPLVRVQLLPRWHRPLLAKGGLRTPKTLRRTNSASKR
jgi:peptidoglycan/xylan/chitin deacetylase (PgdA/CDA1 family)